MQACTDYIYSYNMDDEHLIAAIQSRPAIYNKKDRKHHNRDFIIQKWTEIALEMESEVNAVKTRWGHLRDYFMKKYRESKTTKSGQAATRTKKWHLYDVMSFLIPLLEPRETSTNLYVDETAEIGSASQASSQASSPGSPAPAPAPAPQTDMPPPYKSSTKRKSTTSDVEILKALKKDDDEDEMWARSLVPSMRKLDHLDKMEFRVEVQASLLRFLRRKEGAGSSIHSTDYQASEGAMNYCNTEDYYQRS